MNELYYSPLFILGVEWVRVPCFTQWYLFYYGASESKPLLSVLCDCGGVQWAVPVQSFPDGSRRLQLCEADILGHKEQRLSGAPKIQPAGICWAAHAGHCGHAIAAFVDLACPCCCSSRKTDGFCVCQRQ